MGIGFKIREYRFKYNMTQKDLAEKLHVTFQAVSKCDHYGKLIYEQKDVFLYEYREYRSRHFEYKKMSLCKKCYDAKLEEDRRIAEEKEKKQLRKREFGHSLYL